MQATASGESQAKCEDAYRQILVQTQCGAFFKDPAAVSEEIGYVL